MEHHIVMQEWTPFIVENYNAREAANEQNPYTVVIAKRTAGCTENQGRWPWTDQQHVVYFFSKVEMLQLNVQ